MSCKIRTSIFALSMVSVAMIACGSPAGSAKSKKGDSKFMIKSISIEHTNPSMGPHETIRTFSLSNTPEHKAEFENFLDKGTVFGFSFREFIRAHVEKDNKVLDRVRAGIDKTDRSQLTTGGTISNLTIYLADKEPVQLRDLRYYSLGGGYQTFISYLVQKGSKSEVSGWDGPKVMDPKVDEPLGQPTPDKSRK